MSPALASTSEINAALSSSSTVSTVGSRLSRQYSISERPRRARPIVRYATTNDPDSNTKPPASTPNAQATDVVSAGARSR